MKPCAPFTARPWRCMCNPGGICQHEFELKDPYRSQSPADACPAVTEISRRNDANDICFDTEGMAGPFPGDKLADSCQPGISQLHAKMPRIIDQDHVIRLTPRGDD